MDIVMFFIVTTALIFCAYQYHKMTRAQEGLFCEVRALEMKITRTMLTTDTIDVRTNQVPRMEETTENLLKRIAILESEFSAVSGAMEYMNLLKFQMETLEKLFKNKVDYLDQTTGGMAKASTEIVEMYQPVVNQMNMLSARMDGMMKKINPRRIK